MKSGKHADCGCGRKLEATGTQLGLDELMIVNPAAGIGGMFLGDDGTLYQVQGSSDEETLREMGELFLGDDGSLYRAEHPRSTSPIEPAQSTSSRARAETTSGLDGYLLAADGTLYEVTK